MSRSRRIVVVVFLFSSLVASRAAAQTPAAGLIAASGNIGILFPDNAFENTFVIEGTGEYYVTPRVSVRALLGYASPGFDNRTEDHFRQVRLLFNGIYNWERGNLHPYVTGGAGAYF